MANIVNTSTESAVEPPSWTTEEEGLNELGLLWDYIYVGLACVWLILGVPGNTLVFVSCVVFKEMHTIPMALAANLAVSDALVASANVATTFLTVLYDRTILLTNSTLCTFTSILCGLGCVCSMASICNIAINRYVAICHNGVYSTIYNKKTVVLHLLGTWLAGAIITGPALVGFNGVYHKYDSRQMICARSYLANTGYNPIQWYEIALLMPTSMFIMVFTYTKIFSKVRNSSKNLQKNSDEKATFTTRDLQLLKTLIIMFVAFLLANFPWFTLMTFDFNDEAPHSFYYISVWIIHTGAVLNPIIYASKYPQFQDSFKKILKAVSCGLCFRGGPSSNKSMANTASAAATNRSRAA